MSVTVEVLIGLRNRVLDDFTAGQSSEEGYREDLGAIAVEIDRLLSPDAQVPLEERTARVLAAILAESRARHAEVPPAKAARLEFWRRRRLERIRSEDPQGHEAALREEEALAAAEPDEVRMARPILAALSDKSIVRRAEKRVRAIAGGAPTAAEPNCLPAADGAWTEGDRLSWEEFAGGVPCQGCGRPFLGDETSQRDGEPWQAYRERMKPIEADFRSRHLEHGSSWTVGGGPAHCRRCCAPHPLSPAQVEQITKILNKPTPSPLRRFRCGGAAHAASRSRAIMYASLQTSPRSSARSWKPSSSRSASREAASGS